MNKTLKYIVLVLVVCLSFGSLMAQRRVTPVTPTKELKVLTKEELKEIKKREKAERHYADSVARDSMKVDSIKLAKRNLHPLLVGITTGINLWDPLMRAFGQDHGGVDVWGSLNLRNRYFPTVELGMGMANSTPDEGNFTYKNNAAFYAKIGANYNFMYAKKPKYQLYGGARLGFSSFKYDVKDITVNNGYWGDQQHFDILDQKSSAFWGELLVGIQVGLFKNFSMGWTIRYHFMFHLKDNVNSRPWYIPGYGTRDNPINASLSLIYTIPFHKSKAKVVPQKEDKSEE